MEQQGNDYKERRQCARHCMIKIPEGELTLMYEQKPIGLIRFKDISPFGICLLAAEPAKAEDIIQIRYHHKDNQLDVKGSLMWQEINKGAPELGYWLGIRFWPHNQGANIALFDLLIDNLTTQQTS